MHVEAAATDVRRGDLPAPTDGWTEAALALGCVNSLLQEPLSGKTPGKRLCRDDLERQQQSPGEVTDCGSPTVVSRNAGNQLDSGLTERRDFQPCRGRIT